MAKNKTKAKTKPTEVWLVLQNGGASSEWYAHWFDSLDDAELYRADADKHTYDTLETQKFEFPAGLSDAQINKILDSIGEAAAALLSEATR